MAQVRAWFSGLRLVNIAIIIFGTIIFAFGIIHFNLQNGLAHGGFTGITLLGYYLFAIEPSISNLILNVPLFLIGYKLLGRKVLMYSIIGTLSLSAWLHFFETYWNVAVPLQEDMTLVALFAGVFAGAGLGIIFRAGGTTGGVDILARLAEKYFGISLGTFMFMFDSFVITSSLIHLSLPQAMYTLVTVFVAAKVIDFIIEGANAGKSAMIISDKSDEIGDAIIERMARGSTVITGRGSFTKGERNILYCVINRNQLVHLRTIVNDVDPYAFFSVHDVREVTGEGFTYDKNNKPIGMSNS
ncbi:YitT family protein [Salsuginibacillus kocurii]|uniref:YitT family protein n=1 Tax=Salsuginibacillus kocurii TaxID=427078 RepID=UPI000377BB20|nr:YitT family protein [Salsuginibacillus kocurii]